MKYLDHNHHIAWHCCCCFTSFPTEAPLISLAKTVTKMFVYNLSDDQWGVSRTQSGDCRQPGNSLLPGCGPGAGCTDWCRAHSHYDVIRECAVLRAGARLPGISQGAEEENITTATYNPVSWFMKARREFYPGYEERTSQMSFSFNGMFKKKSSLNKVSFLL